MNYTMQRCITLTCRSNINFDVCRKFTTTLVSCNRILTRCAVTPKWNLQLNQINSLYSTSTSTQFECAESNLKTVAKKCDNNYSAVQLKKRPKKRKSLSTDEENTSVSNYN